MTNQKESKIKDEINTLAMCERLDCDFCEALNELGNILKERGELTKTVMIKLARCFYH